MKFTIIALLLLFVIAAFMAPTPAAACCHTYAIHTETCSGMMFLNTCNTHSQQYLTQIGTGKGYFQIQPISGCSYYVDGVLGYDQNGKPIVVYCHGVFNPEDRIDCTMVKLENTTHATMASEVATELEQKRKVQEEFDKLIASASEPAENGEPLTMSKLTSLRPQCDGGGYLPAWVRAE